MITLGLDVGGSFLKTVVHDDGGVIDQGTGRLPASDVLDHVTSVAERTMADTPVAALGVGLAGLVRWPDGSFAWGPHMPDGDTKYRALLEARLGIPVVVDNDANLAAFGESRTGAGTDRRFVLMLMFGTGIGAGIVVDGTVYRGRSFAGEVGHMMMQPDGDLCACGRRGCWETLVSGQVLDRRAVQLVRQAPDSLIARLSAGGPPDASHLGAAARSGDDAARAVLEEAGTWLGRGVANLILVLDPDVIVVGGAVAKAGRWLLDPARTAIASFLPGATHRPPTPVVEARHGRFAGAVGAALLARDLAASGRSAPDHDDQEGHG